MNEPKKKVMPIERIIKPFQAFLDKEASGGILLLLMTIVALAWANSPFADSYFHLWHTKLSIGVEKNQLNLSLHHWINDGLMAIFFFVVGLEIKREFLVGELSSFKKASLPIMAALGGMIFPALIYVAFNFGKEGISGWGIPMATDIAFAIGILALLGSRVPVSIKIFITALAIADDIGAVIVIALFYTSNISLLSLGIGGGILVLLIVANLSGIRNLLVYTLLGICLWLAFLFSGVHATIAGVLFAFTIPASARLNTAEFFNRSKKLIKDFDESGEEGPNVLSNENRQSIVQSLEENCEKIMTPLQRFEHGLHPWVSYLIMPVFALANAGVLLGENFFSSLTNSISDGIIFGLFFGKQIGIFLFTWLAVKFKIASAPAGVTWKQIYAAGILAGIGFTMSLFIANLAFSSEELLDISKVGILVASLLSGVIGYFVLKASLNKNSPDKAVN
ncbi:MAG TPA: Na+/H+ antiporter NhaA [Ignavibacteriaceae bacterium]|nr:Na+/H+ antiporter NhaA [Ignavibacteriaceae bacterium]